MNVVVREERLADVAEINPRVALGNLAFGDSVAFVPMAAMSAERGVVTSTENRSVADLLKGFTPFQDRDILIAKITPCFENGKIGQVRIPTSIGFGSTEFHVVRPRSEKLDGRYLHHFLRRDQIRHEGERRMTGSAGQRRVPAAFIADLQLRVPPLPEQRRIADILDKADALRAQRRAALAELDTLTQSIFLDLFGDPATNQRAFTMRRLGDLAVKFSDGPFGSNLKSSHYTESGVRVIRLQNIGIGEMLNDNYAFISEEHFASLQKHECLPGDVLVGTLGDPNLRACIQPTSLALALNKADCVQIRPDGRVANAAYVGALLNQPAIERMAQDKIVGQTRLRISMGRLRELVVPLPPLKLQTEFARRIASIETLKSRHRAALAELDTLFASLQHRAFRGEL